jgi:hypothetical protein
MGKHFFMKPVLNWLAVPGNFNRVMAITLRSVAVLVVPLGLVTFFKAGKVTFELPASEMLGGIFFEMAYVVAIYCVVHGLYIRANDIDHLKSDRFNMFSLAAIIIRSVGETGAAYLACVSLGGGVYVWFTAKSIRTLLDPLPTLLPVFGGTNFIGGIQFMMAGMLSAVALLSAAYLLADAMKLLTNASRRQQEYGVASASPTLSEEEPVAVRRTGSGG